ncbi:MAG: LCP family protein [Candidatus Dormibacteraeota bacterium]|nr:LCP family protein [Candidatus Dormibacteraeota bacterium]
MRGVLSLLILAMVAVVGFGAYQVGSFLHGFTGFTNPLSEVQSAVAPAPGSVAWKLQHNQRVNLALLGYGGAENDAPWLTDSMIVMSLDPAGKRAIEVSVPRDMTAPVDAFTTGRAQTMKINAAYEVGMDNASWSGKKPQFSGADKDRGGRLVMQTLRGVTGLTFDGYVAVDFKAFRDVVDTLGGVDICLSGPLDDYQYPNYHNGFVPGGIHFQAGCQHVNGEKALQLARSRHAIQPDQSSDFGRSRRQQLLLAAIRKKATAADAITKAPELMSALRSEFSTSLTLADLRALYSWGGKLPDSAIGRAAITSGDLLTDGCSTYSSYELCPVDPSLAMLRQYFANVLPDEAMLKEKAPVQVVNSSRGLTTLGNVVTSTLRPLGLNLQDPQRGRPAAQSVIVDYSGGRYPATVKWLESYFGATVQEAPPGQPSPTPNAPSGGLAVVLGHDYALRFLGQG